MAKTTVSSSSSSYLPLSSSSSSSSLLLAKRLNRPQHYQDAAACAAVPSTVLAALKRRKGLLERKQQQQQQQQQRQQLQREGKGSNPTTNAVPSSSSSSTRTSRCANNRCKSPQEQAQREGKGTSQQPRQQPQQPTSRVRQLLQQAAQQRQQQQQLQQQQQKRKVVVDTGTNTTTGRTRSSYVNRGRPSSSSSSSNVLFHELIDTSLAEQRIKDRLTQGPSRSSRINVTTSQSQNQKQQLQQSSPPDATEFITTVSSPGQPAAITKNDYPMLWTRKNEDQVTKATATATATATAKPTHFHDAVVLPIYSSSSSSLHVQDCRRHVPFNKSKSYRNAHGNASNKDTTQITTEMGHHHYPQDEEVEPQSGTGDDDMGPLTPCSTKNKSKSNKDLFLTTDNDCAKDNHDDQVHDDSLLLMDGHRQGSGNNGSNNNNDKNGSPSLTRFATGSSPLFRLADCSSSDDGGSEDDCSTLLNGQVEGFNLNQHLIASQNGPPQAFVLTPPNNYNNSMDSLSKTSPPKLRELQASGLLLGIPTLEHDSTPVQTNRKQPPQLQLHPQPVHHDPDASNKTTHISSFQPTPPAVSFAVHVHSDQDDKANTTNSVSPVTVVLGSDDFADPTATKSNSTTTTRTALQQCTSIGPSAPEDNPVITANIPVVDPKESDEREKGDSTNLGQPPTRCGEENKPANHFKSKSLLSVRSLEADQETSLSLPQQEQDEDAESGQDDKYSDQDESSSEEGPMPLPDTDADIETQPESHRSDITRDKNEFKCGDDVVVDDDDDENSSVEGPAAPYLTPIQHNGNNRMHDFLAAPCNISLHSSFYTAAQYAGVSRSGLVDQDDQILDDRFSFFRAVALADNSGDIEETFHDVPDDSSNAEMMNALLTAAVTPARPPATVVSQDDQELMSNLLLGTTTFENEFLQATPRVCQQLDDDDDKRLPYSIKQLERLITLDDDVDDDDDAPVARGRRELPIYSPPSVLQLSASSTASPETGSGRCRGRVRIHDQSSISSLGSIRSGEFSLDRFTLLLGDVVFGSPPIPEKETGATKAKATSPAASPDVPALSRKQQNCTNQQRRGRGRPRDTLSIRAKPLLPQHSRTPTPTVPLAPIPNAGLLHEVQDNFVELWYDKEDLDADDDPLRVSQHSSSYPSFQTLPTAYVSATSGTEAYTSAATSLLSGTQYGSAVDHNEKDTQATAEATETSFLLSEREQEDVSSLEEEIMSRSRIQVDDKAGHPKDGEDESSCFSSSSASNSSSCSSTIDSQNENNEMNMDVMSFQNCHNLQLDTVVSDEISAFYADEEDVDSESLLLYPESLLLCTGSLADVPRSTSNVIIRVSNSAVTRALSLFLQYRPDNCESVENCSRIRHLCPWTSSTGSGILVQLQNGLTHVWGSLPPKFLQRWQDEAQELAYFATNFRGDEYIARFVSGEMWWGTADNALDRVLQEMDNVSTLSFGEPLYSDETGESPWIVVDTLGRAAWSEDIPIRLERTLKRKGLLNLAVSTPPEMTAVSISLTRNDTIGIDACSLGCNDAYFVRFSDGTVDYCLCGEADAACRRLEEQQHQQLLNVWMHPAWLCQEFVIQSSST